MTLNAIDRFVAVLIGVLCTAVMISGMSMRGDAGVFPIVSGALGLLACLSVAVHTFISTSIPDEPEPPMPWQRFFLWCTCLLGLMGLLVTAGSFIAIPLFLLASLRWLAQLKWRWSIIITLAFSAMIYLVFVYLLSVPLP